jgi:hypothetical protein
MNMRYKMLLISVALLMAMVFFCEDANAFGRFFRGGGGCANGSCGSGGCSSGSCANGSCGTVTYSNGTLVNSNCANGNCANGVCTPEQWMANVSLANSAPIADNTLTVSVPDVDAEVWLDNYSTSQRGLSRTFSWNGNGGAFTIRARWKDGPSIREEVKHVPIKGRATAVSFGGTHQTALISDCGCGGNCSCFPVCECGK